MLKAVQFSLITIMLSFFLLLATGCPPPAPPLPPTPAPVVVPPPVAVPPLPEIIDITVDPKTTALLVLDMQSQTCSPERRPSCVASIPKIKILLDLARTNKMFVIYSLTRGAQVSDIVTDLKPLGEEPVVASGPDKFIGTDLETILKGKNITHVIVTGTAANGAGLHTAAGAAFRGFKVIVPVDGIPGDAFSEYYTVWHLANAPGARGQVAISRSDKVRLSN